MRRLPLFTSSALPASPFARRAPAPPATETFPHPTSRPARGPARGAVSTPNAPGQQPPHPRRQRSLSHPAAATRPHWRLHRATAPTQATQAFAPVANPTPARRLGPAATTLHPGRATSQAATRLPARPLCVPATQRTATTRHPPQATSREYPAAAPKCASAAGSPAESPRAPHLPGRRARRGKAHVRAQHYRRLRLSCGLWLSFRRQTSHEDSPARTNVAKETYRTQRANPPCR
jgi:hypothetical protein